jgi:hypothetical protein
VWFRLGIRQHVNEALGSTHTGGEAIVVPALQSRRTRGLVASALKHRIFFNRILAWKCENLIVRLRGYAASARHPFAWPAEP